MEAGKDDILLKNAYTSKKRDGQCHSTPDLIRETLRQKTPFQRSRGLKVVLSYAFLMSLLVLPAVPLYADFCTAWRDFGLTAQEGVYDDTFTVEGIKFFRVFRNGDVQAEMRIKNVGTEDARAAISIALFDSEKFLLTTTSFSPPLLEPNDVDQSSTEFLGSAEVLPKIKYYQLSIIKRAEK